MSAIVLIVRSLQLDEDSWPLYAHSLYHAFAKFIFVIALSLTVLPSLLGCKYSCIRLVLDTNFFNIIAKISFCTYLIHLTLISIWNSSRKVNRYYSYVSMFV